MSLVRISAVNAATQIIVTDSDDELVEQGRGTGDVQIDVPPGKYWITYWLGSGVPLVERIGVTSLDDTQLVELPDTPESEFSSPAWVGGSSRQARALRHRLRVLEGKTDTRQLRIFVRELGSGPTYDEHMEKSDRPVVWVGSQDGREYKAVQIGGALSNSGYWLTADMPDTERGAIGLFGRGDRRFPVLMRPIPTRVSTPLTAFLLGEQTSEAGLATGRHGSLRDFRFSLLVGDERSSENERQLLRDEALIERLARPGDITIATLSRFILGGTVNSLAHLAALLLYLRTEDFKEEDIAQIGRWMESRFHDAPGISEIPDSGMLHNVVRFLSGFSAHNMPLRLELPVLTETWRLLTRVPLKRWRDTEVSVDKAALRAAHQAVTGGHYFAWTETEEQLNSQTRRGSMNVHSALAAVDAELVELANIVSEISMSAAGDLTEFCDQTSWWERSALERRIINYLTTEFPEGYFDQEDVPAEELSQAMAIPLPIVAVAIHQLVGGSSTTNEPTPHAAPTPSVRPVMEDKETERERSVSVYA